MKYKELLFPYTISNNSNIKYVFEITNYGKNLEYLISSDEETIVLFSNDFYFKLVLETKINYSNKPKYGFMNSSNAFKELNINENPFMSLFNYKGTGIKVNLNTNLSQYDIKSKNKNIENLINLINQVDPGNTFIQNQSNFSIIYKLNEIKTDLLGELGYIHYNKDINNAKNKYNISLYSNDVIDNNFKNDKSKFLNVTGTINKNLFPNKSLSPFYKNIDNNISLNKVTNESQCRNICYNNLDKCQAWEFNKNNCWTYNSKTNDIKKLLQAQAPITLFNPLAGNDKLNIRVPNIQNNKTCPDTIRDPIINSETPTISHNMKNSNIKWNGYRSNLYWNLDKEIHPNDLCNVQKIINNDEIKLKKLQDELLILLNNFDSLIQGLEKNEQNIYRNLLNQQIKSNNNTNKFTDIKKKIDAQNNDFDVEKTLDHSINDTLFNLINVNYNLIIYTILAITIIIAAIYFSRTLKTKSK